MSRFQYKHICPNHNQENQTGFFEKSIDVKEEMTEMLELPDKEFFKQPP